MRFARRLIRGADVLRNFRAVYEYCFWLAPRSIERYRRHGHITQEPAELEDFCHDVLATLLALPVETRNKIGNVKAWISGQIRLQLLRQETRQRQASEAQLGYEPPWYSRVEHERLELRLDVETTFNSLLARRARHLKLGLPSTLLTHAHLDEAIMLLDINGWEFDADLWTAVLHINRETTGLVWRSLKALMSREDSLRWYAGELSLTELTEALHRDQTRRERERVESEKRWQEAIQKIIEQYRV